MFDHPIPEIATCALERTGWEAPPGWYGFVPAASVGILRAAGVEREAGMEALKRLASPDEHSRSPEFDGRRMIRMDGGFLVLNYEKYRERDYTGAERARRYRERKAARMNGESHRDVTPSHRDITQAEAEVEVEDKSQRGAKRASRRPPEGFQVTEDMKAWAAKECPGVDVPRETSKFLDHTFATARTDWVATWRNWIRRAKPTGIVPKPKVEATPEAISEARRRAAEDNLRRLQSLGLAKAMP